MDRYTLDYRPYGSEPYLWYLNYARVYKETIKLLLKLYLERPPQFQNDFCMAYHDYRLAPLIFLLRQYIENQLKGLCLYLGLIKSPILEHNIAILYTRLNKYIKEKFGDAGLRQLGKPNEDCEKFIVFLFIHS